MEKDTDCLLLWAAAISETVEINTKEACSTIQVISLYSDEKKKLIHQGIPNDEASELSKVIVEQILSRGFNNEGKKHCNKKE